jgi:uncharacterized RDD family membrane protein YckC
VRSRFRQAAVELRTPEGFEFSLPLAGTVSRLLAMLVDLLVVIAASTLFGKVFSVWQMASPDAAGAVHAVLYFLLSTGYNMAAEWAWHGQTVGKRLTGIRVMDRDGLPITPAQIAVRNILRAVDMLPVFYLAGAISVFFTRHAQRLGDLAANTVVVRSGPLPVPDIRGLFAGKFNSLAQHAHLAARLRHRVTPQLAGVALDALVRRDLLDPAARLDLFAELAARFRHLVEFPESDTEALSDEVYVRNVVEILYRPKS